MRGGKLDARLVLGVPIWHMPWIEACTASGCQGHVRMDRHPVHIGGQMRSKTNSGGGLFLAASSRT
jgi:hypothetical protein